MRLNMIPPCDSKSLYECIGLDTNLKPLKRIYTMGTYESDKEAVKGLTRKVFPYLEAGNSLTCHCLHYYRVDPDEQSQSTSSVLIAVSTPKWVYRMNTDSKAI